MNNISENTVIKTPKNQFIENVQKWVLIDKQLKIVNEKTKRMRELKHEMADNICNYMNENNMKQKKISITGGELKIYDKKEYSQLNYGYIEKCLGEIIPDKTHVEYIINYLKDNREISISQELRGNYTNE